MEGMCEGNTLYNSPVPSIVDMVSGRSLRLCEHGVYVSFSHKTRTRKPGDVELGKNKPNGLYLTTMDFFLVGLHSTWTTPSLWAGLCWRWISTTVV